MPSLVEGLDSIGSGRKAGEPRRGPPTSAEEATTGGATGAGITGDGADTTGGTETVQEGRERRRR